MKAALPPGRGRARYASAEALVVPAAAGGGRRADAGIARPVFDKTHACVKLPSRMVALVANPRKVGRRVRCGGVLHLIAE